MNTFHFTKVLPFLFIFFLISSCYEDTKSINCLKNGENITIKGDTFQLTIDSVYVKKSELIQPIGIADGISPRYMNTTNKGYVFESKKILPIGTVKIYRVFKKIDNK